MAGDSAHSETQNVAREFLSQTAPFDRMSMRLRQYFLENCELKDYAASSTLLEPRTGRVAFFYLIVSGRVDAERPGVGEQGVEQFELAHGENFPMAAMIGQRATRTFYRAGTDVRCLRLPREAFEYLLTESASFRDYCLRGVSSLLDQVQRDIQQHAAGNLGGDTSLETPLRDLMQREALACSPDTAVRKAVQMMHEKKVGSIVVVDQAMRPVGIFTLHDLRAVIAQLGDLEGAIQEVMTQNPRILDVDTFAFEAVVEMARHHIRHMIVTEPSGRLAGAISERDIFALQRINLVHLTRAISTADSVESLVRARADVGALIDTMMAHGAGVEQITRIITLLNDRTVARAIELCRQADHAPKDSFTWIAFGSEGRSEQTRVTDQDNGMLFDPGDEAPDTVRQRLLPLAREINEVLDQCGFTLCTGNIMASNPALCLSFSEWQSTFRNMIASATPENILHSTIYFDFRPVWGDIAAGEALHRDVTAMASGNSVFLHSLAANCMAIKPPLGVFRDFVTEKDNDGEQRVDLKIRGLTPFVDAARVLGLQAKVADSNTPARLRGLVAAGVLSAEDAGAFERSFAFIQLLRMREHQRQAAESQAMHNRLDPDELNSMDRRILRAAFREARRLQKKLELRFQL
jgi:CBS domain-containing protein